jgi:hypothetical protein
MSGRSSTSERPAMCAAMLCRCVRGKRDESDCDPEHHALILRPIELLFLHGPDRGFTAPGTLARELEVMYSCDSGPDPASGAQPASLAAELRTLIETRK